MKKFDTTFIICATAVIIMSLTALVAINESESKVEIEKIKQGKCLCQ